MTRTATKGRHLEYGRLIKIIAMSLRKMHCSGIRITKWMSLSSLICESAIELSVIVVCSLQHFWMRTYLVRSVVINALLELIAMPLNGLKKWENASVKKAAFQNSSDYASCLPWAASSHTSWNHVSVTCRNLPFVIDAFLAGNSVMQ